MDKYAMDRCAEELCRAAVEVLLDHKVDLKSRQAVRRALDQANVVPAIVRRSDEGYEAFLNWVIPSAEEERLERLLMQKIAPLGPHAVDTSRARSSRKVNKIGHI